MLKKQEAIVLKTIDYGETNKIVTLFTRDQGKIAVLAKGAKKPNSQYRAVTQPFVVAQFLFYQGSGLPSLSQGETIYTFKEIQLDIVKTAYASYIVELVDKLTEEKKSYFLVYDWLVLAMHQLNNGQDPEMIARIFDLKMLGIAGAKPQLDCCASCGSQERDPVAFSVTYAGFLCNLCRIKDERAFPLTLSVAKLIRALYYLDFNKFGTITVKDATKQQLNHMLTFYYDEYVGIQLKSKRFLKQLMKMDQNLFKLDNDTLEQ
ncbi:DNA repair protein RecO (recombination protein O) [Alkalihalobacillus xiaoxiensis]|uniref:DNA repair protein RecO n=1 Tax=Shouchella xiaoxiensis TaxID=766895 RepID=A0ABS2SRF4_9BACI|nr:DNA repair protein RecO [Shouchella xiaoxiensis]MBM7838103.1 DNA repair protein RecO (recombination protein O) [Shouchella xiaoxiensis]